MIFYKYHYFVYNSSVALKTTAYS